MIANEAVKRVVFKLGDFVKGTLTLDHMADHPLKVIPPKFSQVGKEMKVRVFSVDGRRVELTKKDSLMKDRVPIYGSLSDLRPGMQVYGVVVGRTEHGFVVKTFNGLKGLLKHDDVKENSSKLKVSELKAGCAIKAYCLFVKKGSGIALTLSKKKAKKGEADDDASARETLSGKYLPNEDEMKGIIESYQSLISKAAQPLPSDVSTYRVCESRSTYYIVKSVSSKKPRIAVLPKCLSTSFGIALPYDSKEFSFEAMTIGVKTEESATLAIVCARPELIALKEEFNYSDSSSGSCVAIVEAVSAKTGITVRFNNAVTKLVALRDVSQAEKVSENYAVGQIVRLAKNKLTGRLSLKRSVIEKEDG